jgi:hypothetical protein
MNRENPTPESRFRRLSTHEARMTFLSFALIERTGNRWFSRIGFAFHERTRADLADSFALIERTNFGRRRHGLAGASSLIFFASAVAVRQ